MSFVRLRHIVRSNENEIVPFTAFFTEEAANNYIKEMVQRDFEELPEPGDYDEL